MNNRLFLVEGIATILMGFALWFLMPDCEFLNHSPFRFCSCFTKRKI